MKWLTLVAVIVATCMPAMAATPVDYSTQWPLQPSVADAPAYTVTLDESIYRSVQRGDARDLDVLDARGRAMPATIASAPSATRTSLLHPAWFVMPPVDVSHPDNWRVVADLDADGRLRGLRTDSASSPDTATTLLVDLSGVAGEPVALTIDWTPGAPFERAYRVEGSDDFDNWYPIGHDRLVDLQRGTGRLLHNRLSLAANGQAPRYLRVVPEESAALPAVTAITVEARVGSAPAPSWLMLAPRVNDASRSLEFTTPARVPVRWVDLEVIGNDARQWRVESRESADLPWLTRIEGWVAYRLGTGRSAPQDLGTPVRDRYWRLTANGAGDPPRLRLGYAPEQLIFLAGGQPPYLLVAGSTHAVRANAPVAQTLASLRASRVAGWQPPLATVGAARIRAGDAALAPVRDWKSWALWAVLGIGVVVVGAFALRVLREPPTA